MWVGLLLCAGNSGVSVSFGQRAFDTVTVQTAGTMAALLRDEDTDGDLRITVHDPRVRDSERGDRTFSFAGPGGTIIRVNGTYYLSALLEELTLAHERGDAWTTLLGSRVFAPPALRISRNIRERYWAGLTRSIDEKGLQKVLADDKVSDGPRVLYVPADDTLALNYFQSVTKRHAGWALSVHALPVRADSLKPLPTREPHGLLSLALVGDERGPIRGEPFVVPGGRFNELYGWDSYFIILGLLQDGNVSLARSMVDDLVYEIDHYGGILNANRSYYLSRSQPPFLTSMLTAVFSRLPNDAARIIWLRNGLVAAIKEYRNVWSGSAHRTPIGLSRYYDVGSGVPPEVEPGHYAEEFKQVAAQRHMQAADLEHAYRAGTLSVKELDVFFEHDRAMRESGHDTSYRLAGVCADLATVDLNALLFKYEHDIARMLTRYFGGALVLPDGTRATALEWEGKAARRQWLVHNFLWSAADSMFVDYDVVQNQPRPYVSATALYPLWAGLATPQEAGQMVRAVIPRLEVPGGIVSSTEASRGPIGPGRPLRQWDYPFGWAPHQMLTWEGLHRYGYDSIATRLAYRWLHMIAVNAANYNGTVTEKYDVVRCTHEVFAEYGNVGTKFAYITREGFGWTNASFQVGLSVLTDSLRAALDSLVAPDTLFPR